MYKMYRSLILEFLIKCILCKKKIESKKKISIGLAFEFNLSSFRTGKLHGCLIFEKY